MKGIVSLSRSKSRSLLSFTISQIEVSNRNRNSNRNKSQSQSQSQNESERLSVVCSVACPHRIARSKWKPMDTLLESFIQFNCVCTLYFRLDGFFCILQSYSCSSSILMLTLAHSLPLVALIVIIGLGFALTLSVEARYLVGLRAHDPEKNQNRVSKQVRGRTRTTNGAAPT